ncbi:hypothetical protein FALBO_1331 [Fusarium albosuccineum]|uniref:Uncharacterized protein n=1 Tax=Fusarium albosuccineum TaxID=1237068 RepID=A0A8H4PGE5_9HYPO|nr:hypothetical protein FALBO_1331 [Fusarium albosuccineum]
MKVMKDDQPKGASSRDARFAGANAAGTNANQRDGQTIHSFRLTERTATVSSDFFTFHDSHLYAKKVLLNFLAARLGVQGIASLIPIEAFTLRLELITKTRNYDQRDPLTRVAGANGRQQRRPTLQADGLELALGLTSIANRQPLFSFKFFFPSTLFFSSASSLQPLLLHTPLP